MSLIPYASRKGREIILKHHNAVVVRDHSSQRLEIRDVGECPTCHRPLRSKSPERQFEIPIRHENYVDPDYFRMLQAGHIPLDQPPSSPVRRLVQPILADDQPAPLEVPHAEFAEAASSNHDSGRIRREAFSPNYFQTFFIEERELGRGGRGVVLLVQHHIDGCHLGYFACKRVPVGDDHTWLEKVLVEVTLLAKLSHPNLVSYRHAWLEDVQLNRFGPSVACAFILQQYCNGGDLHHYIVGDRPKEETKEELKARMRRRSKGQLESSTIPLSPQRRLPFEEVYSLFKDITSGLAHLHDSNYVHRDLKPSNCLLHREGGKLTCLISDFGEVQPENVARKSTGSTGTISYCAPEVLRQGANGQYGNFTTKSDIFSLGLILYFMCFGHLPYSSANAIQEELEDVDQLRDEITHWKGFQDERRERPDLPSKLYHLLKRLLALDPGMRPSAAEVLGAIKNEAHLDGVPMRLVGNQPASRIHNLDSPSISGSPVPDSDKQHVTMPGATETLLVESQAGSRSIESPTSHLRESAVENVGSHDLMAPAIADLGHHASSNEEEIPNPAHPLLLPPPQSKRQQEDLITNDILHDNFASDTSYYPTLLRLAIFVAKMATLARHCHPYMINQWVGLLLVLLAGVDLGISGLMNPALLGALAGHGWARGLRPSIVFLIIHACVVWFATRQGILCPASRDIWVDLRNGDL